MSENCLNISKNNELPEVIDLFSGCGGLALGFQTAGFQVTHGIELIEEAVETASYNLHWRYGEESGHICGDITEISADIFAGKIGPKGCIVIGGPPCQAYSLAGRAKLRSLGEQRVNTNDKRGYLYQDFLRFVIDLRARAVVMENVVEATNYGGQNIPQTVCEILEANGYTAYWTILNSADFGVPQIRERVIVIGILKAEGVEIELPVPGYSSTEEKITQSQMRFKSFAECPNFRVPNQPDEKAEAWVTVGEAITDLPELFPSAQGKYILNKITMPMAYCSAAENSYQQMMRNWYGTDPSTVTGNCFRKTLRDFPIFAEMEQGDDYIRASEIADVILERACKARGIRPVDGEKEYEKLKKAIVPPYDRENFTSKWQKLCMNKPSHTLVAHLSVDTYSHIHPYEPRGISVREAARLQSFPDGFLFQCSMGDAFKQIGNAVPPLLAKGIADQIKAAFQKGS